VLRAKLVPFMPPLVEICGGITKKGLLMFPVMF